VLGVTASKVDISIVHTGYMDLISRAESWLCDMDGVLIRERRNDPGCRQVPGSLALDRSPVSDPDQQLAVTPREIREELSQMGLNVEESDLWTSSLATAKFVHTQRPFGTAFVIGQASLHEAIRQRR